MAILTEQTQAVSLNLTDLVHIARPTDLSQSDNGSSYKATIAQLIDAQGCCLSSGIFSAETSTIGFYGASGGLSFSVTGITIFSGGSSNCINNLYLNNINPCEFNINIQPMAVNGQKTYFGKNLAASGFTIFHVEQSGYGPETFNVTQIGLNTAVIDSNSTFQFKSFNQRSEFRFYDAIDFFLFRDLHEVITLTDGVNDVSTLLKVQISDGTTALLGSINNNDNSNLKFGVASDTFLSTYGITKGLNIVSTDSFTDDSGYIRFFLGGDWELLNGAPHIHIDGDNPTKGFMGVGRNNISPTSLLDVSAVGYVTNGYQQLRLRTPFTVTNSSEAVIPIGTITWDDNYLFVKVTAGQWRRLQLSTF